MSEEIKHYKGLQATPGVPPVDVIPADRKPGSIMAVIASEAKQSVSCSVRRPARSAPARTDIPAWLLAQPAELASFL